MAEIKISDLSIGDWVAIDGVPSKVMSIDIATGLLRVSGKGNPVGMGIVEPIPLTAEILEKNGFRKCGRCCTSRTTAYIKDFTFVNLLEERKVWRVKIYGEEGLVELCSILVHHTHQLQHVLRLAGVGKEIEV